MNISNDFLPTLRIVLTSDCNGKCFFCHREGFKAINNGLIIMDVSIIKNKIIPAINEVGIPKVVLTGGEPTLYNDLFLVASSIKKACSNVKLQMTSNGYDFQKILELDGLIDKITLSVSSLEPRVFDKYTSVDPYDIVKQSFLLKKTHKAVSIVITKDNYVEIEQIVSLFVINGFSVKLQFVISEKQNDLKWKREVLYRLMKLYGDFKVDLGPTPVLFSKTDAGNEIRIKLGSLNKWMYDNLFIRKGCYSCNNKTNCIERGCAIRVFPDGKVTSCLDSFKVLDSNDVKRNIIEAYKNMVFDKDLG